MFPADAFFDFDKSVLNPEAKAKLDDLVGKTGGINLEVIIAVGHTDSVGTDGYNQKLSVARADAVKSYLVSKGVERNRVYTEGKGEKQPVVDNKTAAARAKNRRVEIEVVRTRRRAEMATPSAERSTNDVPVFFATNRQPTGSESPYHYYGNDLLDEADRSKNLRRGIAVVHVPEERGARGTLPRAGEVAVTIDLLTYSRLARALGIRPIPAGDPRTQFTYARNIEELQAPEFAAELKHVVGMSKKRTAFLYVHGYANGFTDAVFRAAQIAYDLSDGDYNIVPMMFSWPSDAGVTGINYKEAQKRSEVSGYELARFLEEIASSTDIGTVHLIAHSMGARVLGHALLKMGTSLGSSQPSGQRATTARPVFNEIVFASPDITPQIFENLIEPAVRTGHSITAYGATTDLALLVSSFKNVESRIYIDAPADRWPKCVDIVDVTAVAERGLAHSTWAEAPRVLEDLQLMFRDRLGPASRGLMRTRRMDATLWTLQPTRLQAPARSATRGRASTSACR